MTKPEETGSENSKMAASNHQICVTQLVQPIAMKYQVLPMFSGSSYQMDLVLLLCDQTGINRKWEVQDGGFQTSNACISACTQDINANSTALPMFWGPAF